jgi:heme/copper-type cytochrome/quinol oxidase subunit 2
MRLARQPLLMWFGVLGAPAAWTLLLWSGAGLTLADCAAGIGEVPVEALVGALAAVAVLVAILAGASARSVLRATRDASDAPPGGRVHFLATIGIVVSFLFGCLIVMTGLGIVLLDGCHQG